jgi:hypothetical protein
MSTTLWMTALLAGLSNIGAPSGFRAVEEHGVPIRHCSRGDRVGKGTTIQRATWHYRPDGQNRP